MKTKQSNINSNYPNTHTIIKKDLTMSNQSRKHHLYCIGLQLPIMYNFCNKYNKKINKLHLTYKFMKWVMNYKILQKHYLIKQYKLNNNVIKIQSIIRKYLGKIRYYKIFNERKRKLLDIKSKIIYQIQCFIIILLNKRTNKNNQQKSLLYKQYQACIKIQKVFRGFLACMYIIKLLLLLIMLFI